MIPDSLISRLNPYRPTQTISLQRAEFEALVKGDTALSQEYRIALVETEEKHLSRTLSSFKGTFTSVRR